MKIAIDIASGTFFDIDNLVVIEASEELLDELCASSDSSIIDLAKLEASFQKISN